MATEGQPFLAYPGVRLGVGDVNAGFGTDASKGVQVLEAGVPAPFIIPSGGSFTIQTRVRTALGGAIYNLPTSLVTNFYVYDLFSNSPAPGSPFVGGAPLVVPAPAGDHGKDGTFDNVVWYSIETPQINGLPDGTYRITVHGRTTAAEGVLFIEDGTILQVGP